MAFSVLERGGGYRKILITCMSECTDCSPFTESWGGSTVIILSQILKH